MNVLEVIRLEESEEYGTFGILKIDKEVFCATLEPPDLLNRRRVSSVPAQQYICQPFHSPKFGSTYMLRNVPDRDYVLFHPGNSIDDTQGCIVTAEHFGKLRGKRAVLNSGNTFREFMRRMDGAKKVHLTIMEVY